MSNRTWRSVAETPFKAAALPDRLWRMATAEFEETPYEVVDADNKVRLRRYEPDELRHETPIVYAFALFNRPSIIDLKPDRSVVRRFLEAGFEVYVIDWGRPSRLDVSLDFRDYVDRYIDGCVDEARERSGGDDVHLFGYSTSVPPVVMYAALYPEKVATLGLKGPTVNFEAESEAFGFREFIEAHDPETLVDVFGNVPAPMLDMGFVARKPIEYAVTNPLRLWDGLEDEEFVEQAALRARWFVSGPGMVGGVYRQFVEDLMFENALFENELSLDGRPVDLSNVDMPVLVVAGEHDKIVPQEAYEPFLDRVPSEDTTTIEFPTGHVGLSVEPEAHEVGWPAVCEWLEARS